MKEGADEEIQLWSEVKNNGGRIDQLVVSPVSFVVFYYSVYPF